MTLWVLAPAAAMAAGPVAEPRKVDINRATRADLKSLPGIGDAEAARIIAHRPYPTKTHLVEKKVLSLDAYDKLSRRIVVDHRRAPAPAATKPGNAQARQ